MLRHIRKLTLGVFSAPSFIKPRQNADGSVDEVEVKSNIPLPSTSTTDVELLEKSGLPLKKTKTRILKSKRPVEIADDFERNSFEQDNNNTQTKE